MPKDVTANADPTGWDQICADLKDRAQAMHEARETALKRTRVLGQLAAKSIRHVHRHQFEEARRLLAEAMAEAGAAREVLRPFPDLNSAYLHDTEKEMVEAAAVLAIVHDLPFPTARELGAQTFSYLNGMGEGGQRGAAVRPG